MRKALLLSFLLLAFMTPSLTQAAGGPDAYGYTWTASTDAGGPTYNWIDISAAGTPITGLSDDNVVGPFNIGWSFHYYWSDYTSVRVGSNGWIRFGTQANNIASCFPTVPTAGGSAGDNFLAVFMNDLNFAGAGNYGSAYYWSNNVDSFIVTWDSVPYWVNANPDYQGYRTFQVILNGADSSITYQYKGTDGTFTDNAACPADIEIGFENLTGNIGLEILNETLPPNNFAVYIDYPAVPLITIPDATPNWAANVDNAGQFFQLGTAVDLEAEVKSVGNGDVTGTITVTATVRDLTLAVIYNSTATITGPLTPGSAQTVTFTPQFVAPLTGQYYFQVATSNASDINPSNNQTEVEISIPATNTAGDLQLTYSTGNPPDGSIAWSGGNAGVGVKMVAPGTPITIKSVEMFITADGDIATPLPAGFDCEVWDDNAGSPGSMLTSVTVDVADAIEDDWNVITFASPITITAGEPFYIAWMMNGVDIAIGTEAFGPISRRSYEILGGGWAVYRDNSASDFLIRVNLDPAIIISEVTNPVAENMNMTVMPNPAQDQFVVAYENKLNEEVTFTLVDMYGKNVYTRTNKGAGIGNFEFPVNTSNVAAGIYFMNMESVSGRLTTKVVVSH
jgi:Secretion system C-terminal sorting domain